MKEIIRKDWEYILYQKEEGSLLLSVTCGRSSTFEIGILLKSSEIKKYKELGEEFIQSLAWQIQAAPQNYLERNVY